MSDGKSNPPKGAIWFLQHLCPGDNEALTGDLMERFREGQTRGWFRRQVFIAFAIGIMGEIRSHWPHFCYAIAGTAMPLFLSESVRRAGIPFHWWTLPWPWSQLVMEMSATALLALAALPILAVGLEITRAFHWLSLLRTALINLTLLTLGPYLLDVDVCPWLWRPVPGDAYYRRYLIVPPELQVLLVFSTFLAAAWIGCLPPRHDVTAQDAT
jgi:hypothetical protein